MENNQTLVEQLFNDLFPICRSITGNGVRETFKRLNQVVPFDIREVPSGTSCYDWTIPFEWNITDAFIADVKGERLVSLTDNNLHVVNYSIAVDCHLSFEELKPRLHILQNMPDAIPYRTTYYKEDWGFCLTHAQLKRFKAGDTYHVVIKSTLTKGSLTYGERILTGTSGKEYLISTYSCHPSLANDNLSGTILWTLLLKAMSQRELRHSYRFIIIPETIGAIAYLAKHEQQMKQLSGGFVITTVAGPGPLGYKNSFLGKHQIDRAVRQVFKERAMPLKEYPFDIAGSDERQFSSPYFRIPIGTISKDKYYEYDYYHTSKDDLSFVSSANLLITLEYYLEVINCLEYDATYRSLHPQCEPMLGKRGLYPSLGGSLKQSVVEQSVQAKLVDVMLWLMFYADGEHSLLDIAERTGFSIKVLHDTAQLLCAQQLLERLH